MKGVTQQEIWQQRLHQAVQGELQGTSLAAFNSNVDVVVHLDPMSVQRMLNNNPDLDWDVISKVDVTKLVELRTREEFIAVLMDRVEQGKSTLLTFGDARLSKWLEGEFPTAQDKLGGQAGIMATQLAALGASSVLYSPILSKRQAEVLHEEVLFPLVNGDKVKLALAKEAWRPQDPTRSPWVFEYGKGETFNFGHRQITTTRANRVIVVPSGKGIPMNFTKDFMDYLGDFARQLDVGMVAGYHLGGPDPDDRAVMREYLADSLYALKTMREANPQLKLHLEYVPMKDKGMEKEMLVTIGQGIDSFGINEVELGQVLSLFGENDLAREIAQEERAYALYQGGLRLFDLLGVERLHVHNLGYYVLITRKPYFVEPHKVRQACLYGSSVNAKRALTGRYAPREELARVGELLLSEKGLKQQEEFARELGEDHPEVARQIMEDGYGEMHDHYVFIIPAHIVPDPVLTVGMGDTISSSTYAMEVIGC